MTHYRPYEPLLAARDMVRGPALVLAPHPDDEVIGCGGVVLAHREAGVPVHVVVLTDGARGNPGGTGGPDYTSLRRAETQRAAELLGGPEVHFLGYADGTLRDTPAPADDLLRLMESLRPRTLVMPSPYEVHPDHRATSLLGFRALRRMDDPPGVLLFEVGAMMPANLLLDVTPYMLRKEKALEVYHSQLLHHDLLGKMRALNRSRTTNVDDPAVRYAEAYVNVEPAAAEAWLQAVERLLELTDGMAPR